ncbi:MAG TPA: protein kinase [Gemmataceae bacterium]|nr:protein kinase [Gemmataceae bacterium]
MSDSESTSGIVLFLAEEFLDRYRRGERPPLKEYIDRHPDLETEIREVFPAMARMEKIALANETVASGPEVPRGTLPFAQLGEYRLIREVGRGGMGVVYEAEQASLGRRVALKVLPPQARDGKLRLRFEREARAAAKLHHTNIVPVFGVGEHDGQPYYVMQFIHGLGLDEVLRELRRQSGGAGQSAEAAGRDDAAAIAHSLVTGAVAVPEPLAPTRTVPAAPTAATEAGTPESSATSRLSGSSAGLSLSSTSAVLPGQTTADSQRKATYWQSVAQIGIQVASALEYAHKQGVLHRDVKPSNLLLDSRGIVWVTDFGLAKAAGQHDLTHTGDVLGTLRYMPPEAFDRKTDVRGDVYSLGLTLYEMVALRRAFDEGDRPRLVKQVATGEPPRLESLAPAVPRDLATIIQKAIAKEPGQRYQTAGEFAADLARFADDRPIRARRLGALERAWRWSRRNPQVAGLAAAVVVLLVAGSVISTVLGVNATLARDRADANAREAIDNAQRATEERNRALAEQRRADREADAARANLYVVRLNSIQLALENLNGVLAQDLLDQVRPAGPAGERTNWEWCYHWRACHRELRVLKGHTDDISGLAVSPDGTRLVSCADDGTLREWDPATGRGLRTFALKGCGFPYMAMSADGTRLAVGSDRGDVKVIDAVHWQELHTFQAHRDGIRGLAFSPDGARLVTASEDRTLKMWTVAGGQPLRTFTGHTDAVRSVAFSPDGRLLASGSQDATARIWNAATGETVHTFRGHTVGLNCVVFSPDGRQLVSAGKDWAVRLWDAVDGHELYTLTGHTAEVRAVAVSPDGKLLASAGHDRTIKLWDVATGRERSSYLGHRKGLYNLVFSPDGRWLASGSSDLSVRLWGVTRDVGSRADKSHDGQVRAVEFSPDGRWLTSVGLDGKVIVRDVVTGQSKNLAVEPGPGLLGLAYSPDGRLLATCGDAGAVTVWDAEAGRPRFRVKMHDRWSSALAFSPDGKLLASGGEDRTIKLLDAATGEVVRTLTGHEGEVRGLVFGSDGRRLYSGAGDETVRVWDVDTGQQLEVWKGHSDGVTGVALSPDGRWLASSSSDQTVKVWEVATGRVVHTLTGHNESVWRVRFISGGARLVSAGWDQSVRVWDPATGLELVALRGHFHPRVLGVAVSPDGRLTSAGGQDLTVRVWDGRPPSDQTELEREAVDLLSFLFSRPLRRSDVIAYLNAASSLRPELRALAVELAERFDDPSDAGAFYDAAWRVLKHPYANATMSQFAHAQMTAACESAPDNMRYRIALAAAQYRVGKYQKEFLPKALATLERCDPDNPIAVALLAMTQHRLDKPDPARATLARLRQMVTARTASPDADAEALFREAEEQIERANDRSKN